MEWSVRGVRGATTATENTEEAVVEATKQLLQEMMGANGFDKASIASVIFTTSPDLNAAFPAQAARELGLHSVPLLGAGEVDVPGALSRCIRVLMHVNTTVAQRDVRHVYLREARSLRPDLCDDIPEQIDPAPRPETQHIKPYVPGKSIEQARREYNIQGSFIKLASNENPLGPSPKAVQAASEAISEGHTYPDGAYTSLRQKLAELWQLAPEHFIVGNGSDAVIKMIGEAYLQPGDEIVCADPTFSQYEFAASLFGARTVTVPLDSDWRHDLSAMADAIGPRTKAVFLCNPNNPTGTVVSREQFAAFMDRVPRRVLVVIDEAYGEYTDAFGREWIGRPEHNVLVLRTFSKVFGLAGLRIGYGMANERIIETLRRVQEPFQVNAPAQAAARAALNDEDHLKASLRSNAEGKKYFYNRFAELGMTYVPSEANFIFVNTGYDSREVCAQLLKRGVIVRGGDAFGQSTWLRITIGTKDENERLFDALIDVTANMVGARI